MVLQSIRYHFHRLDLTRQGGFIVTVYDEDDLRLAETPACRSPDEAFAEARKIVDCRWKDREAHAYDDTCGIKDSDPNRRSPATIIAFASRRLRT